nr:hypothetical protein [Candidatus Sigynarchaeota archaeon]
MSETEKKVKQFLKDGQDWEKYPTQLEGVSIVKMPGTKARPPLLALEVNPYKDGKPIKRKGLFITNADMLLEFTDLLMNDSLPTLMKTIDGINTEAMPKGAKKEPLKLD